MKRSILLSGKENSDFPIQTLFISFILILMIFSCSRQNENSGSNSINYKIDTVIINSKEEIIFLKQHLLQSDIASNEKYLYNFNLDKHQIERINLDLLELEDVHPMEKEGPNGIGTNIWIFNHLKDHTFFIGSYEKNSIVTLQGEKYRDITFDMFSPIGDKISPSASVSAVVIHPDNENIVYAVFNDYLELEITFCKIDVNSNEFKVIELPEQKKMDKHYIRLNDKKGKIESIMGPAGYLDLFDKQIFIYNSIGNLVYKFSIEDDTIELKRPDNELFNFSKKELNIIETESSQVFLEQAAMLRKDIQFGRIIWDSKNNTYYRFSFKELFDDENLEQGPKESIVYLSIFNSDYELISELKVDSLLHSPITYFVKDGMIWVFKNIEDEMGFIRLDFN